MMKVVIIGGGPAGIRACRTIKILRPDMDVVVIRPEAKSLIYCAMPYVLEDKIDFEKIYKKDELITGVGASLIKASVVAVDLSNKTLDLDNGSRISYDRLLIATGAEPILPDFVPAGLENVFVFKREDHLLSIHNKLKEGAKKAIVVGAGSIGIEMAQAFKHKGLETHLIEASSHLLPSILDKDMSELVEEKMDENGIHLHLSTMVSEVRGNRFAEAIVLSDGARITLSSDDIVLFSVGMRPNVDLFKDSGLGIDRDGIIVNERMETNIEGVYAAGDCTSFKSVIDGRPIPGKLATNAVPMGKVAGRNIAGRQDYYEGFVNGAATIAYGVRVGGTGFNETVARKRGFKNLIVAKAETTAMFPIFPEPGFVKVKLIVNADTGDLLGAQVVSTMCVTEKVDILSMALQNKLSLDRIAKLSYSAQPYQSFLPANNAIVMAAEDALRQLEDRRRG